MDEIIRLAKLYGREMDEDYERYYRTSFSNENSSERGYYYTKFKSSNTPSQRYCDLCRRGFLTSNAKKQHKCDIQSKKGRTGRYKCMTCLHEATRERKMEKHVKICKKRSTGDEIGLEYETMTLSNTPHTRLCPLCFKGFKTFESRELHFVSCREKKNRVEQRTPIIFCRRCGRSFLMKTAALRHFRRCRDREIRGGMIRSKGKKIKKDRLGVTQKTLNFNITDLNVSDIADIIFENTRDIITSKLEKNDLKIWSIFEFFVVKNEGKIDEEIFPTYFNTGAEQIFIEDYWDTVQSWAEFGLASLDEWLERGSGAKFLKFTKLDLFLMEFKSDIGRGKTSERLHPVFFKKGRVLNLINEPLSDYESCFHTCICAYDDIKHERVDINKKKTTRDARLECGKILDYAEINIDRFKSVRDLSSPFVFRDVRKMSKELKPLSYNIFKLCKNKGETVGKNSGFHLVTAYLGKQATNNANEGIVNLLYYSEHFYLILDLDNLVQYIKGRRNSYGKLCFNCLNAFDTRRGTFDTHQTICSKGLKTNIVYPEPGTIQEFKRWSMLIPAIAYVVCDFESSLIPIMKETQIPPNFYKKKRLLNIANYPSSHHSHLHTCVCAFYDIKLGNADINRKKNDPEKNRERT